MKFLNLKPIFLIVVVSISTTACKKKNATPVVEEPTVTCFNSQNNGSYDGSGSRLSSPFTSGTITITRASCDVINYNLNTNTAGQIISQASQLTLNSAGAYEGIQNNNGNNITLTFGSVLNINAIGSFTFTGTKQP
jgi:hypothetical protein